MVMLFVLHLMGLYLNSSDLPEHLAMMLTSTLVINFELTFFFPKFYRRYYDLISKFQVGRKSLLFYSPRDFRSQSFIATVHKITKIVGTYNFQRSL